MSGSLKLRILATTDLHAHLLRYDYLHDTATSKFGLEGLVDVIRAAALDCDAAILVDNGDLLQGSLMGGGSPKIIPWSRRLIFWATRLPQREITTLTLGSPI
jgi:2',3'-cyclic-nucleotide 2'-phosphodiesterase (5'-nucleotidase family)